MRRSVQVYGAGASAAAFRCSATVAATGAGLADPAGMRAGRRGGHRRTAVAGLESARCCPAVPDYRGTHPQCSAGLSFVWYRRRGLQGASPLSRDVPAACRASHFGLVAARQPANPG